MSTPPTITPDQIDQIWCDGDPEVGSTAGHWTLLAKQWVSEGRWHNRFWLVLRHNRTGEIWALSYGLGLTENQDDDLPWEGATAPILMTRPLYRHEITRVEYRTTPTARPGSQQ